MDHIEIREEICDIGRRLWQKGWVAANDGNITVKVEENLFLTTPTRTSKGFMTTDMILRINNKGELIGDNNPNYSVTSEIKLHLGCFQVRPDIGACVHAHPSIATAHAVAGIPLNGHYAPETMFVLGSVPIAPFARPGTEGVAESVKPFLREHDSVLMGNHGVVTVGSDLTTAYFRMESTEYLAVLMLNIHLLGGAPEIEEDQLVEIIKYRRPTMGNHPGLKKYCRTS